MLRYPAPLQPGDRHRCGRTRPQARRIVAARRRQPRDARRQPAVLRLRPADDSLPDAASQVLREMRAAVDEGVEQLLDDAGGVPEHLMPGVATRCSVAKPSGMASTASWALLGGTSGSCSPTMTSTGQRTAAKPARRSMSASTVKCRFTCGVLGRHRQGSRPDAEQRRLQPGREGQDRRDVPHSGRGAQPTVAGKLSE